LNDVFVKLLRIDLEKAVEYAVSKAQKAVSTKDADKVIESCVAAIQAFYR
jgi:hypothetical protein